MFARETTCHTRTYDTFICSPLAYTANQTYKLTRTGSKRCSRHHPAAALCCVLYVHGFASRRRVDTHSVSLWCYWFLFSSNWSSLFPSPQTRAYLHKRLPFWCNSNNRRTAWLSFRVGPWLSRARSTTSWPNQRASWQTSWKEAVELRNL